MTTGSVPNHKTKAFCICVTHSHSLFAVDVRFGRLCGFGRSGGCCGRRGRAACGAVVGLVRRFCCLLRGGVFLVLLVVRPCFISGTSAGCLLGTRTPLTVRADAVPTLEFLHLCGGQRTVIVAGCCGLLGLRLNLRLRGVLLVVGGLLSLLLGVVLLGLVLLGLVLLGLVNLGLGLLIVGLDLILGIGLILGLLSIIDLGFLRLLICHVSGLLDISGDILRLDDHIAIRIQHIAVRIQREVGHCLAVLVHQNLFAGLSRLHVASDFLAGLGFLAGLVATGHQTHGHHQSQQQGHKILHLFHCHSSFLRCVFKKLLGPQMNLLIH